MAYSDYGAFVWKDKQRRTDKEDVAAFASDEETFGRSSKDIPSGARIWVSIINQKEKGEEITWLTSIHHGILGDGKIRVVCHKQGLPQIYECTEDGIEEIKYHDDEVDWYDYGKIEFDYKDHHFKFISNKPYYASMIEPDGSIWECEYDYEYGAGF